MPSHHSSSSHSSHSSSSHSSSSRSSSSRSSYSSRSSGSRSSYSSRPSGHSASSHSSRPLFGGAAPASRPQSRPASRPVSQPVGRPRFNQPVGFLISQTLRPTMYYGRRHDYVYYPESWTDATSGTHYEKGYYDENGKYYDSVAFQKNGRYENVVCYCPYCENRMLLNLNNTAGAKESMQCPNCGAPMEIRSELDEITGQPAENTHGYQSEESLKNAFGTAKKKRGRWLPVAVFLAVFLMVSQAARNLAQTGSQSVQPAPYQQLQLTDQKAEHLYLERQADGSYHTVTDPIRADRILDYDTYEDSYYDAESDCWLWYNTEVDPPVWQYWVEGISSDFGEYGWMEHDEDGWWIEASNGNWIQLPAEYSTDGLWYID